MAKNVINPFMRQPHSDLPCITLPSRCIIHFYPRLLRCTYRLADCIPDVAATTYAFAGPAGVVARGLTQTRTPRMMGCHCRPARLPARAPLRLHLSSYISGRVGALPAWSRTTRGERLQGTIQMDTEISGGYTRCRLAVLVPDHLSPCPQTLAPDFVHDCRTKSGRCVHLRDFESYNAQYYTREQYMHIMCSGHRQTPVSNRLIPARGRQWNGKPVLDTVVSNFF